MALKSAFLRFVVVDVFVLVVVVVVVVVAVYDAVVIAHAAADFFLGPITASENMFNISKTSLNLLVLYLVQNDEAISECESNKAVPLESAADHC